MCAIVVSLLIHIVSLLSFTDDSYNVESNHAKNEFIQDMEKSLEAITNWLKITWPKDHLGNDRSLPLLQE
jgi:hypothetical protein